MSENKYKFNDIFVNMRISTHLEALKKKKEMQYRSSNLKNNLTDKKEKRSKN